MSRPDPPHQMASRSTRHGLYMGRLDNYLGRPMHSSRPMDLSRAICCSELKGACAYSDVIVLRYLLAFRCFFPPSEFSRTATLGPRDTHNQHSLLIQFCFTNDSVGWLHVDYHLLVLLQRPQQQQQQQQHVLLKHPVLLPPTLLHPLSSKDDVSTSSDINASTSSGGGFSRYSNSPHPRFHTDTHETSPQRSVRRCPLSGPSWRSCTGGSVSGMNQGKNVMLPASARRQGVWSVHPQRYQRFAPTFALGLIHPRRFATNL